MQSTPDTDSRSASPPPAVAPSSPPPATGSPTQPPPREPSATRFEIGRSPQPAQPHFTKPSPLPAIRPHPPRTNNTRGNPPGTHRNPDSPTKSHYDSTTPHTHTSTSKPPLPTAAQHAPSAHKADPSRLRSRQARTGKPSNSCTNIVSPPWRTGDGFEALTFRSVVARQSCPSPVITSLSGRHSHHSGHFR